MTQSEHILYFDNIVIYSETGVFESTDYFNVEPIFISDPWFPAASVTIRDFCVVSYVPTNAPSISPTMASSIITNSPSFDPSMTTNSPSNIPSSSPSLDPSEQPTIDPTINPSLAPTIQPSANTINPTLAPSSLTNAPSISPTRAGRMVDEPDPNSEYSTTGNDQISGNETEESWLDNTIIWIVSATVMLLIIIILCYMLRSNKKLRDDVARLQSEQIRHTSSNAMEKVVAPISDPSFQIEIDLKIDGEHEESCSPAIILDNVSNKLKENQDASDLIVRQIVSKMTLVPFNPNGKIMSADDDIIVGDDETITPTGENYGVKEVDDRMGYAIPGTL